MTLFTRPFTSALKKNQGKIQEPEEIKAVPSNILYKAQKDNNPNRMVKTVAFTEEKSPRSVEIGHKFPRAEMQNISWKLSGIITQVFRVFHDGRKCDAKKLPLRLPGRQKSLKDGKIWDEPPRVQVSKNTPMLVTSVENWSALDIYCVLLPVSTNQRLRTNFWLFNRLGEYIHQMLLPSDRPGMVSQW